MTGNGRGLSSQQQQSRPSSSQQSLSMVPVPPLPLFAIGNALLAGPAATSSTLLGNHSNTSSGLFPPLPLHMLQAAHGGSGTNTLTNSTRMNHSSTINNGANGSMSARTTKSHSALTRPRGRLVQRVRAVPPMALTSAR